MLGSLAGWQIALIIIGSVLGFILLLAIIIGCCCLWKKRSRKTSSKSSTNVNHCYLTLRVFIFLSDPNRSSKVRLSPNEHTIRRTIPPPESTHHRRRSSTPITLSTSLGHTEQRRLRQSPDYDHYIRPTIPQPTSESYDPSDRQDIWHTRPQIRPLNHERYPQLSTFSPVSRSFDPMYPSQVLRDRRRALGPDDDDVVLQF